MPQLVRSETLSGSGASANQTGKFPRAVSAGNQVYIAANPNTNVSVWSKVDTAPSFGEPANLGSVSQSTNYANASIAVAPDGTAYAVWITYKSNISIRRKPANGTWETANRVYTTGSFINGVDIAVASDGKIFVTWNENFLYRYRTSTNGGANWSGTQIVTSKKPRSLMKLASGTNGQIIAGFSGDDGNVYAAPWNGSSFDTVNVTPFKTSSDYFADPTVSVAPNGKFYIAFRNGNDAGGVFYSERQSNNSWPVSKLAGGPVYGVVSIDADDNNNLHIFWSGQASGGFDMWYAFKPATGDWQGPVQATGAKTFANVSGTGTVNDKAYGHGVAEIFSGDSSADKYYQFASESNSTNATPLLDGGLPITRNNVVAVSFSSIIGGPDGVRYHWDAAPTDADPWVTFTNPLTVPGPTGVTAEACQGHTLFTQVRKGTAPGGTGQDGEIFDIGVQASVNILNRHMAGLPASYSLSTRDVYTGPGINGASDGDQNYTRERSFFLGISGFADCSGLSTYAITGSENGPIANNFYAKAPALPGGIAPGPHSISVEVKDALGNASTTQKTLIYDPASPTGIMTDTSGLPVLGTGGSATAGSANSVIRQFSFQGITVTDNLYG
ncbi:MAG: sialidase family protein, partial [Roseiflexaceae bacterium]